LFAGELSMDQTTILQKAESNGGFVSQSLLESQLGWDKARSQRALDCLMTEGLAWIDTQNPEGENLFWIPSIYSSLLQ
jgi:ESCRT-II complex subunit VPS22